VRITPNAQLQIHTPRHHVAVLAFNHTVIKVEPKHFHHFINTAPEDHRDESIFQSREVASDGSHAVVGIQHGTQSHDLQPRTATTNTHTHVGMI
jgi:hypothetical protein